MSRTSATQAAAARLALEDWAALENGRAWQIESVGGNRVRIAVARPDGASAEFTVDLRSIAAGVHFVLGCMQVKS